MQKTVLVTGSNGYIGSHLVTELLNDNSKFKVVATDISNEKIDKRAIYVPYNLFDDSNRNDLYGLFYNPDIVVHLAWTDGFNHNADSHLKNFYFHYSFLKSLINNGVKQVAVAGSFREYGKVNGCVNEDAPVFCDNNYTIAKIMLKKAIEVFIKEKEVCFQWLRPFTVFGDDALNQSILSKILTWEADGKVSFPFTDGNEEYDYICIDELSKQIIAIISQQKVSGVINCCSGRPTKLKDKVNEFISENNLKIRPEYGAYKSRNYDSPVIYGNNKKIASIMREMNW